MEDNHTYFIGEDKDSTFLSNTSHLVLNALLFEGSTIVKILHTNEYWEASKLYDDFINKNCTENGRIKK